MRAPRPTSQRNASLLAALSIAAALAGLPPAGMAGDGSPRSAALSPDRIRLSAGYTLDPSMPGYAATPGWDPITGLGTPNAANLVPGLAAAAG